MKNLIFLTSLVIILSIAISCAREETPPITETGIIPDPEPLGEPFSCEDCTHVVEGGWKVDGEELNLQPGDIVCLSGATSYGSRTFQNINGTPENPIIIRNCDGVASINPTESSFGIKFKFSSNFRFVGDGGGGKYGIKISTNIGFHLAMDEFTTDFELAYVEIDGRSTGYAGFGIKTSPYLDCDLFTDPTKSAWVMRNVSIHDNYIHNTPGEGMYIGHGLYAGGTETGRCEERTYSHSIRNLKVYNNLVENVGLDGIQVKNADENCEVYNNIINGFGGNENTAHDEGLLIGEGTTGKFYNNIILNGHGTGIRVTGLGNLDIYNNVVINAGNQAFVSSNDKDKGPRLSDGYFNIFNNTFHSSGQLFAGKVFTFFDDVGGTKRLINNIMIAPNAQDDLITIGATMETSNNIVERDVSLLLFTDFSGDDVTLQGNSPAVDAGQDLTNFGITVDILGTARPQGAGFDIGAYEFKNE